MSIISIVLDHIFIRIFSFVLSLITVMCTANSVSVSLIFFVCSWVYCAEVFDITTRGRGNGVTTL